MKNYLNVVECAIEWASKFLIIKRPTGGHAGGLLSLPSGKVDEVDERNNWDMLRAAAKREILEELGIHLQDPLRYVTSSFFVGGDGSHVINSIFHCQVKQTDLTIRPSAREVAAYYWLSAEEINESHNAPDWLRKYVAGVMDMTQNM